MSRRRVNLKLKIVIGRSCRHISRTVESSANKIRPIPGTITAGYPKIRSIENFGLIVACFIDDKFFACPESVIIRMRKVPDNRIRHTIRDFFGMCNRTRSHITHFDDRVILSIFRNDNWHIFVRDGIYLKLDTIHFDSRSGIRASEPIEVEVFTFQLYRCAGKSKLII